MTNINARPREDPDDDPPRDRIDAGDPGPVGRDHLAGGRPTRSWSSATCTATSRLSARCSRSRPSIGIPRRHLVLQELIHGKLEYPGRQGRPLAPAPGPRGCAQVPVSRPGPPDPGQSRALRADGPDHRQGRQDPQHDVPHGDRRRPTAPRPARSMRPTRSSSPRSRWRSARRTASSSATRSPTSPTSTRWTSSSSRPTPGPRRR